MSYLVHSASCSDSNWHCYTGWTAVNVFTCAYRSPSKDAVTLYVVSELTRYRTRMLTYTRDYPLALRIDFTDEPGHLVYYAPARLNVAHIPHIHWINPVHGKGRSVVVQRFLCM